MAAVGITVISAGDNRAGQDELADRVRGVPGRPFRGRGRHRGAHLARVA